MGATTLGALPVMGLSALDGWPFMLPPAKPAWLVELVKLNDKNIEPLKLRQVQAASHPAVGAIADGDEIPSPQATGHFISMAAAAFSANESLYYRSADLLKNIAVAIQYLRHVQHPDGTIDLLSTNFHSPPDTAFSVELLAPAYHLIKSSNADGASPVLSALQTYLQKAGESLIVGGIHTPNHRWVVSAALSQLNALWPDERYVKRAEQWLTEHIDLDADGQYTEKSTGGYTPLVNRVLITLSINLNNPGILEYVRKNLNMTMYYVHPNGEVVTEASSRQDKGTIGTMENYYFSYRYLALLDNNGEYAAMCRLIEKSCFPKLVNTLSAFLGTPFLWTGLPGSKALPTSYTKAFPFSGVARIRRGNWDATLLSNNAGFLTFHKGSAVLQGMRLVASFFGKGQFQSADIQQEGGSWVLRSQLEGVYYQPYPTEGIDPLGDLSKMPRTNRTQSEIQHLETIITITEMGSGINVDIEIHGTDRVPVSLELIFRKGGKFTGVEQHPGSPLAHLLKGNSGSYTMGNDTIRFGPGKAEHKGVQLRGGLPATDSPAVYLTGFTPFKHTLQLS